MFPSRFGQGTQLTSEDRRWGKGGGLDDNSNTEDDDSCMSNDATLSEAREISFVSPRSGENAHTQDDSVFARKLVSEVACIEPIPVSFPLCGGVMR